MCSPLVEAVGVMITGLEADRGQHRRRCRAHPQHLGHCQRGEVGSSLKRASPALVGSLMPSTHL